MSQAQSGRTGDGSIKSRNIALVYANRRCGIIITIRNGGKRNIIAIQGGTVHIDGVTVCRGCRTSAFLNSNRTALKPKRVSARGHNADTAAYTQGTAVTHINDIGVRGNSAFIPQRGIRQS